jgi:hypothetical protein
LTNGRCYVAKHPPVPPLKLTRVIVVLLITVLLLVMATPPKLLKVRPSTPTARNICQAHCRFIQETHCRLERVTPI